MKWNADPILLEIGPLALRYYSLMFVLGFVAMGAYVSKLFKNEGKDPELVSSLTTHIIVGMLIGSRLVHCLFYDPEYYLPRPLEILKVWEGGLASHGGYFGVLIAVYIFLRKHRDLKFFWIMDVIAGPCLFVGGLIRIGNFFNSEIYGHVTDVPWAIIFQKVDPFPRHPAMLYEAFGYFSIAFLLAFMERNKYKWNLKPGMILSTAMIVSFVFRFFVEFFKAEQSTLTFTEVINMGQILSVAFALLGVVLAWLLNKNKLRWIS